GLDLFPALRERLPEGTPIIMLTASNDAATAVDAMRLGAFDYVTKPFDYKDLIRRVERAIRQRAIQEKLDRLHPHTAAGSLGNLREQMGSSARVQRIVHEVRQVAPSNFTVLIEGETGTGKELVARAIHQASPRSERPFIALDCAAIPEALIESELF